MKFEHTPDKRRFGKSIFAGKCPRARPDFIAGLGAVFLDADNVQETIRAGVRGRKQVSQVYQNSIICDDRINYKGHSVQLTSIWETSLPSTRGFNSFSVQ